MHATNVSRTQSEGFYHLYIQAFSKIDNEKTRSAFFARYNHADIYFTEFENQVISGLYGIHLPVIFHSVKMQMRGIGVVMSDPAFRGKGGPSKLMRDALHEMDEQKVELSYLAPFSYSFYRRFGYEQVFNKTKTILSLQKRTGEVSDLLPPLNQVSGADLTFLVKDFRKAKDEIALFYEENKTLLVGGLERSSWWYDYLVTRYNRRKVLLVSEGDKTVGYWLFEEDDKSNSVIIDEMFVPNKAKQAAIFNYFKASIAPGKEITVITPNSKYFGDIFADSNTVYSETSPYMMARIVNVRAFLERYPFQKEFSATIELTDPVLDSNVGIFQVRHESANQNAEKYSQNYIIEEKNKDTVVKKLGTVDDKGKTADLKMTVMGLTKLMLGSTTLSELQKLDLVEITDENRATQFQRALVSTEPELIDYF